MDAYKVLNYLLMIAQVRHRGKRLKLKITGSQIDKKQLVLDRFENKYNARHLANIDKVLRKF